MNDILVDKDTDELTTKNGDFAFGHSHQQHKKHLLLWSKGALKENPTACVGAFSFLEAENEGDLLKEVSRQFSGDGMNINTISYQNGNLNIDADYP